MSICVALQIISYVFHIAGTARGASLFWTPSSLIKSSVDGIGIDSQPSCFHPVIPLERLHEGLSGTRPPGSLRPTATKLGSLKGQFGPWAFSSSLALVSRFIFAKHIYLQQLPYAYALTYSHISRLGLIICSKTVLQSFLFFD